MGRSSVVVIREPIRERVAASAVFGAVAVLSLAPQFLSLAGVALPAVARAGCGGLTLVCALACAYTFQGGYIRVDESRVTIKRRHQKRSVSRSEISEVILGQGHGFELGEVVPSLVLVNGQTLKLSNFASKRHEHAHNAEGTLATQTVRRLREVLGDATSGRTAA
jgi:hypothetical protein